MVGLVEVGARALARQRLDAAHASRACAFADDLDQTDVAGAARVRAAAQLDRPGLVRARRGRCPWKRREPRRRISRRTAPWRLRPWRPRRAIRRVSTGLFSSTMELARSSTAAISSALMGFWCVKSNRRRSGDTSEPFCATCRPEHLAQGLVQKMGGRVVGARRRAARMIDLELDGLAGLEAALLDACRGGRTDRRASSACR